MKKLLLLSLLFFTALVSQSCKKNSPNIDEGLVPIVFSRAEVTKTLPPPVVPTESFSALVFGSKTSNDWTTIHNSPVFDGSYAPKDRFANRKIDFDHTNLSAASFTPEVYYPTDDKEYIYIKALAPYSAIKNRTDIVGISTGPREVIFEIDGKQDVMATQATTENPVSELANDPGFTLHGCGRRGDAPLAAPAPINLIFDRLLSKINFYIQVQNVSAQTFWGDLKSITFLNAYYEFTYVLDNSARTVPVGTNTGLFIMTPEPGSGKMPLMPTEAILACSVMVYPTVQNDINDNVAWTIKIETVGESGNNSPETREIGFEKVLLRGYEYDVTLTFNETTGIEITTVGVTPWDKEGASSGDINGIK